MPEINLQFVTFLEKGHPCETPNNEKQKFQIAIQQYSTRCQVNGELLKYSLKCFRFVAGVLNISPSVQIGHLHKAIALNIGIFCGSVISQ